MITKMNSSNEIGSTRQTNMTITNITEIMDNKIEKINVEIVNKINDFKINTCNNMIETAKKELELRMQETNQSLNALKENVTNSLDKILKENNNLNKEIKSTSEKILENKTQLELFKQIQLNMNNERHEKKDITQDNILSRTLSEIDEKLKLLKFKDYDTKIDT